LPLVATQSLAQVGRGGEIKGEKTHFRHSKVHYAQKEGFVN
jgi:hypothetical protein